jgi:hypothetical protein
MEDGAAALRHPADQRPARDLVLGDQAHRPLAVQHHDVDPADVVGDEHGRARQRRAGTAQAQAEDPQQACGPGFAQSMLEASATESQASAQRRHQQQHQRQVDQQVPQQKRHPIEIAQRAREPVGAGMLDTSVGRRHGHAFTIADNPARCAATD